jgi:uncharacterized membrane protein YhaH (DUF805 family)
MGSGESRSAKEISVLQTTLYSHIVVLMVIVVLAIAVIWAALVTIRDGRLRASDKVSWVVALVLLPPLGLVAWTIVRIVQARARRSASGV